MNLYEKSTNSRKFRDKKTNRIEISDIERELFVTADEIEVLF